jgi:ribonuclease HII
VKNFASNKIEKILWQRGFSFISGLDEAGRGAFAGPLVTAAVILPKRKILGLRDSKITTEREREYLAEVIKKTALAWAVGISSVDEVNRVGIQNATYIAFSNSINNLRISPDHLLIDYYNLPTSNIPQISVIKGDAISQSIAAASIIAKTTRDSLMRELSNMRQYRQYRFENNLGYGTEEHRRAIIKSGQSDCHRTKYCLRVS